MKKNLEEMIVIKPNELIEIVGQPISQQGLIVYDYLLHRFKKDKTDTLIISPNDFIGGLNLNDNHQQIYDYLEKLRKTSILSKDSKGRTWGAFSLLAEYKKVDEGIFVQISNSIKKALSIEDVKKKDNLYYTALSILEKRTFKNVYSSIFYDIFRKYEDISLPIYTLKELRELTGTENNYLVYYEFKRYLLNKVLKELNTCDGLKHTYALEEIKLGRKVHKIKFIKTYKEKYKEIKLSIKKVAEQKKTKNELLEQLEANKKAQKQIEDTTNLINQQLNEKSKIEKNKSLKQLAKAKEVMEGILNGKK